MSKTVWAPGYAADYCGSPMIVKNYKDDPSGIQAAYKRAADLVHEYPQCRFCTIGPESWLKCWELETYKAAKFKKVNENVVLHFHKSLNFEKEPKLVELIGQTEKYWGYLYF